MSDKELYKISVKNIKMLNELAKYIKVVIISGNSFDSINTKLAKIFGTNTEEINFDVWTENGVNKRYNNTYLFEDLLIDSSASVLDLLIKLKLIQESKISELQLGLSDFEKLPRNVELRGIKDKNNISMISLKELDGKFKNLLVEYLNLYFLHNNLDNEARKTGFSTVDITNKNNNKSYILEYYSEIDINGRTYVGDEIDSGNDKLISDNCGRNYHVESINDTFILLKILLSKIIGKEKINELLEKQQFSDTRSW